MNEWNEWWAVEGGLSSTAVAHYRAIEVNASDVPSDLDWTDLEGVSREELEASPVWLVWSERRVGGQLQWRYDGVQQSLCLNATFNSFQEARTEQLRRLEAYHESLLRLADGTQAAINDARDWKGHMCASMPPVAQSGTFELTGAKTQVSRET